MRSKRLLRWTLLGSLLGSLLLSHAARAELGAIWAVGESTKVRAEDVDHPKAKGNALFDGKQIKLFGLKNEVLGFQLILRGGSNVTEDVSVTLAGIGPIKNGAVTDNPDTYFLERRVEIFTQHYLDIRSASTSIVWKPFSDSAPPKKYANGSIPDALIPHRKPFAVSANRNQGVWVDIYVPKDAPAGDHKGELSVLVGGKPCKLAGCTLPITLEVLDKTLPDVPTLKTMVYFSGGESDRDAMPARYYKEYSEVELAKMDALRARHFKLARRHRVTFFIGTQKKPGGKMLDRLTGRAFTREAGYYGPGEGVPQDMYSILTYGVGKLDDKSAKLWTAWFKEHAPKAEFFFYTKDEPQKPADFETVNRLARAARPVPSFVTAAVRPEINVDIYTGATDHFSVKAARAAEAKGKRVWVYNGVRPFAGSFMTDDVGPALRVNSWIQYKYKIPRWFYWEATYYKDFQGDRGQVDVWTLANNFRNGSGDRLNGDGLLVYPGKDVLHPQQDRGLEMPLPSLRLKNWRRGLQDVEYLALAKAAGLGKFVDELVATMVPKALKDELREGDPVPWPEDGDRWLQARKLLFTALKTGKAPALDAKQLSRPQEGSWKRMKRAIKRLIDPLVRSRKRKMVTAAAGAAGLFFLVVIIFVWRGRRRRRRRY